MPRPNLKGYELLELVGNGAGSVVYKARELATGNLCAIKHVTRKTIAGIEQARRDVRSGSRRLGSYARLNYRGFFDQIRNEYRILRTLERDSYSPHIVRADALVTLRRFLRLHGYDLIMEFVEGVSLREKWDYEMTDLIRFYREAAMALAYLHGHRILHTDMKPHHLFITRDRHVKVIDFGLARFFDDPPGRIQGTAEFMAYEQVKGLPMDPRTDVYGLGATMYFILTGQPNRPALGGMAGGAGLTVGFAGRAASVRDKNPKCPPGLEEIILQSCERRPEKRPSSMTEVIRRLDLL
ncbi:MAG TPA: serine/threonine-protein kinase [Planctomycetota bacterium]|nr:serine/threonine-protein kinase [Planctomycetota bacterium]HRR80141.1 serine/threonine-protein kinase [Planctomycetota bacterium]HRT94964.1 serine/threonine-protein kinase [Planctomycetota bacterium]